MGKLEKTWKLCRPCIYERCYGRTSIEEKKQWNNLNYCPRCGRRLQIYVDDEEETGDDHYSHGAVCDGY